MNPKNIEEYVAMKVISHLENVEELKKEIIKLKRENKVIIKMLRDNKICYNCICSKCGKNHIYNDDTHSHNSHPDYKILCYSCFFSVL